MNDNYNSEPIVLGLLKKQKSSKPAFVVIVFLLLIGTCLGLPAIGEYLKDPNTMVGSVYSKFMGLFGGEPEEEDIVIVDKDTIHILREETIIEYDNIVLTNIELKDNTITYNLKGNTTPFNLDEETLYLEIYGSTNNLLRRVKLTGVIDENETLKSLTFSDLKFNPGSTYYGRIYKIVDDDYPEATLNNDAAGYAQLICTDKNNTYTYTFENNLLRVVNHTYSNTDVSDLTVYMEKLNYYNGAAAKIKQYQNCTATSTETDAGLDFNAKLDLTKITLADLGEYINYNYYELDKDVKVVKYEMISKGYVCK